MNQNHSTTSTTRARSIPNSSKYLKGGNYMSEITTRTNGADFYSIFAGTGITHTYPEEFDVTVENFDDGCDYDEELDDMYEQAEMEELAYYEKLFEEEGGEG